MAIFWWPWATPVPVAALLFVLWFFRDPERTTAAGENALISPADGKVVEIATVDEPNHIEGPATKIAIFMSVFDVHVNRMPAAGTVDWIRHEPGRFLNALRPEASVQNERVLLALHDAEGRPVLVKLIAGLVARRIVCRVRPGDTLSRGRRVGMIKFGSRVEVFTPAGAGLEVTTRLGQKVRAGVTALGVWQ